MDARDVADYVRSLGLSAELVTLPDHTPTVEAAARVVGVPVERIIKSVLFLAQPNPAEAPRPVLVIANGVSRVDYRRVADYLGLSRRRLKLAGADTVLDVTGYPVGAVPPVAHPAPLRTLLDRRVLDQPEIYGGGGAIDTLLRLRPADLARVTQAEIVDVVEPEAT
jgi:prolyl-tRNA editing enzyme YbaK/EbsC (Cys-tRNA(Pro) deacylase)